MKWTEVTEQAHIDDLLERFGYFHDSCLREMHMWTGTYVKDDLFMVVPGELDTNVRLLFQRQCENPSAIELMFEQVTAIHIIPSAEHCDSIIYDAIVLKVADCLYWADSIDWQPTNTHGSWIAAKKMKWREVSNWMGEQLRYTAK